MMKAVAYVSTAAKSHHHRLGTPPAPPLLPVSCYPRCLDAPGDVPDFDELPAMFTKKGAQ